MRAFLDGLPHAIVSKRDPLGRRTAPGSRASPSSSRGLSKPPSVIAWPRSPTTRGQRTTKSYVVHPHRLAYAQGGLYLLAFVPAYGEIRTFAVERLRRFPCTTNGSRRLRTSTTKPSPIRSACTPDHRRRWRSSFAPTPRRLRQRPRMAFVTAGRQSPRRRCDHDPAGVRRSGAHELDSQLWASGACGVTRDARPRNRPAVRRGVCPISRGAR